MREHGMYAEINKWVKLNLFIAAICAIGALLIPKPAFDDLVYYSGELNRIETKGDGGKIFSVKSRTELLSFILPNSTRENNEIIRETKVGDVIEIWYLNWYSLYKNRFEAWQVSVNEELVIPYEESIDENTTYQWLFAILSLIFGGLSLFLFTKNSSSS